MYLEGVFGPVGEILQGKWPPGCPPPQSDLPPASLVEMAERARRKPEISCAQSVARTWARIRISCPSPVQNQMIRDIEEHPIHLPQIN